MWSGVITLDFDVFTVQAIRQALQHSASLELYYPVNSRLKTVAQPKGCGAAVGQNPTTVA